MKSVIMCITELYYTLLILLFPVFLKICIVAISAAGSSFDEKRSKSLEDSDNKQSNMGITISTFMLLFFIFYNQALIA